MTYATQAAVVGREPFEAVILTLDYCGETFGSAPCTATAGAAGKCFNTWSTCQDQANYDATTKDYVFCRGSVTQPIGVSMIPALVSVKTAPTKITPGKGLGYRAKVTITLQDLPHHDRGIDPYIDDRSYDAETQGTFFTKLRARNPFYQGRKIVIKSGFMPAVWDDFADFDSREYVIESFDGPDSRGKVTIIAKDILKLADDKRATAPIASSGVLSAGINSSVTSLTLSPSGVGATYAASGSVRVNDEIMTYTRSSDVLTITRGQWKTTAAAHDADDPVQQCFGGWGANVRDVVDDLLTTYAGIDSAYINATDWDAEETLWLSAMDLTFCVSEPTGVNKLLSELTEQCQIQIWWDERAQEIRFKAIAPTEGNEDVGVLDESSHFLADSIKVKDIGDDRVTQVWIYYALADYTDDQYTRLYIQADTDAESANEYGDTRIKKIKSRWFDHNDDGLAIQTASRIFQRLTTTPREVKFALDPKDVSDIWTGETIDIQTRQITDVYGAEQLTRIQIMEVIEAEQGSRYEFVAQTTAYDAGDRNAFVGPDTLNDYGSESDANKLQYAFIAADTPPYFADDEDAYRII